MAPRKDLAHTNANAVPEGTAPPPLPASQLPAPTRFPLLTVLSLALSALLFSFVADSTGVELASMSRSLNEPWQAGAVLGLKIVELGVSWYLGFDDVDTVSLTTLSHLPFCYLLWSFYSLSLRSVTTILLIDISSIAIPTHLLRPRAPEHRQPRSLPRSTTDADTDTKTSAPTASSPIANPYIVYDRTIQASTTFLASAIYAVVLLLSLYTWLPTSMILHFDGIRSFDRAHRTTLPVILPFLLPIGIAAHAFMFTPSMAARSPSSPPLAAATTTTTTTKGKAAAFDPETATLGETLRWNLGLLDGSTPLDRRIRVLAERTAVVAVVGGANLAVRTWAAVAGADLVGASAWAAVWSASAVATGLVYAWVGDV